MNDPNFVTSGVLADVVWPALYLVDRLAAWWSIGIGLVVEYLVLNRCLRFSYVRSGLVTAAMNGLSSLVGWHLLAWWGWYWAAATDHKLGGTFNPLTWAATCVLACLVSTLLEWPVVFVAARKNTSTKRLLPLVLLANFASVGIAYISVRVSPPYHLDNVPDWIYSFLI